MMTHKQIRGLTAASLAVLLLPTPSAYSQQSPASETPTPPPTESTRARSGPCVLLKNDNVLFGRAYQLGEFVIVRTGQQSEVQLPRGEVACWANSLGDLYRFRVDHRTAGEISAHIRDARWCLRYDLYDLAAKEITRIRQINPSHSAIRSLQDQLDRLTTPRRKAPAAQEIAQEAAAIQTVAFDSHPSAYVDLETLRRFASNVQPMLLNRCGRCHDASRPVQGSGWSLVVPPIGARASSEMTRRNLLASLVYIDPSAPLQSQLLRMATTTHGGDDAPLSIRDAKAVEALEQWLTLVSEAMVSDRMPASSKGIQKQDATNEDARMMKIPLATPPQERTATGETSLKNAAQHTSGDDTSGDDTSGNDTSGNDTNGNDTSGNDTDAPERLPQVANPFDPDLFNRKFHLDSSQAK